ncbi:hypothetical protein BRADI_2g43857v3 [Brachypodium distachyon]|uniref:Uncharacterized protein n=1 Tax=Brachypodium distachyon TaxID=15368 RepID=A0A2K2DDQ7_BRADI|nr:hypothetical protein BRADI_2g43857v3 [Brachypodium distachyon]
MNTKDREGHGWPASPPVGWFTHEKLCLDALWFLSVLSDRKGFLSNSLDRADLSARAAQAQTLPLAPMESLVIETRDGPPGPRSDPYPGKYRFGSRRARRGVRCTTLASPTARLHVAAARLRSDLGVVPGSGTAVCRHCSSWHTRPLRVRDATTSPMPDAPVPAHRGGLLVRRLHRSAMPFGTGRECVRRLNPNAI